MLLILDNHCWHVSIQAIETARKAGIVMLTLPPHTSHRLQPLDRTAFGPMKTYYNRAVNNWMRATTSTGASIYLVGGLANFAFTQSMTPSNIESGFRTPGIYPPNRDIFGDDQFLPADVTDQPNPTDLADRPYPADIDDRPNPDNNQQPTSKQKSFSDIDVKAKFCPSNFSIQPKLSTSKAEEPGQSTSVPLPSTPCASA